MLWVCKSAVRNRLQTKPEAFNEKCVCWGQGLLHGTQGLRARAALATWFPASMLAPHRCLQLQLRDIWLSLLTSVGTCIHILFILFFFFLWYLFPPIYLFILFFVFLLKKKNPFFENFVCVVLMLISPHSSSQMHPPFPTHPALCQKPNQTKQNQKKPL